MWLHPYSSVKKKEKKKSRWAHQGLSRRRSWPPNVSATSSLPVFISFDYFFFYFSRVRSQGRRSSASCQGRSLRRKPRSTRGAPMATATTAPPAMGPRKATSLHLPPLSHPSESLIWSSAPRGAALRRTTEIMSWPWQSNTLFPSQPDFS